MSGRREYTEPRHGFCAKCGQPWTDEGWGPYHDGRPLGVRGDLQAHFVRISKVVA